MAKKNPVEEQVKSLLDQIDKIEGGWPLMLDLLHMRGVVKFLADERRAQGLTQRDLAEKMGISQATVHQFEAARYPDPQMSTLRRYAAALGVSIEHSAITPAPEPEENEGESDEDDGSE